MYNELTMQYTLGDGRVFRAERGHVTADLGYEGHGMFGIRFRYDWGLHTTSFFGLDHVEDYEVGIDARVHVPEDYMYPLITAILKVFKVDYLSSISERESYLLFSDEHVAHEAPLGLVNIRDTQNVLIFDDLLEPYMK